MLQKGPLAGTGGKRQAHNGVAPSVVGQVTYSKEQRRISEPGGRQYGPGQMLIQLELRLRSKSGVRKVRALLDSGSEGNFVRQTMR